MKKSLIIAALLLVFAFVYCGGDSVPAGGDVAGDCDFYSGQQIIAAFGPFFHIRSATSRR